MTVCDIVVALRSVTAGPWSLFAKNSDRPPDELQRYEWHHPRVDHAAQRTTYLELPAWRGDIHGCLLSRPAWMWGAEHGVNDAGVAIGNSTVYTRRDPRAAPDGLTGMDLVRLGLERSSTAGEAVEVITTLIERHGQGGSGHDPAEGRRRPYWSAFVVADAVTGFVIDTSGDEWAVMQIDDAVAVSNRTSVPGFDELHRHPRQPVERFVEPRLAAAGRTLADRPVGVESVQQLLRSHDAADGGWSVCMHAPGVQATMSSMIVALAPAAPPEVWALLGSPCEHDYLRFSLEDAVDAVVALS